jgi:hypothetical protein
MQDFREIIVAKAFKVVPGMAYNQTRAELELSHESTVFYEVVLPQEGTWEPFRDKTYPLFVRYLQYKRINPEVPQEVIVSAFFKDDCHLLKGQEFLQVFLEMEGLTPETFHLQVLQWLAG